MAAFMLFPSTRQKEHGKLKNSLISNSREANFFKNDLNTEYDRVNVQRGNSIFLLSFPIKLIFLPSSVGYFIGHKKAFFPPLWKFIKAVLPMP